MFMKKVFKLSSLDCANCAAKIEEKIRKIDGVKNASVGFMSLKLAIEADENDFDRIVDEAQKVIASVEPESKILL